MAANRKSRKGWDKFQCGWEDGGGIEWNLSMFIEGIRKAYANEPGGKPKGCSWYAFGYLVAKENERGRRREEAEWVNMAKNMSDEGWQELNAIINNGGKER